MGNRYSRTYDEYYSARLMVKITEKQKQMLGIMVDVLGENRSEIVRRLFMAEAKRMAAMLDGEELELWTSLITQIEKEEDYHQFEKGEAIEIGRRQAYIERGGNETDDISELATLAEKQRVWHRRRRVKQKMEKLKELEDKWSE